MADNKAPTGPALNTQIESGKFDEKPPASKRPVDEEEEDEDIDALIEDLESVDGHIDEEDEEDASPGAGRVVPEVSFYSAISAFPTPNFCLRSPSYRGGIRARSWVSRRVLSQMPRDVQYWGDCGKYATDVLTFCFLGHAANLYSHGSDGAGGAGAPEEVRSEP